MCAGCFLSQRWRSTPTTADWCVRAVRGGKRFLCTGPGCCFAVPPLALAHLNHTHRPPNRAQPSGRPNLRIRFAPCCSAQSSEPGAAVAMPPTCPASPEPAGHGQAPKKGLSPTCSVCHRSLLCERVFHQVSHQAACTHRPARTNAAVASTMRHRRSAAPVPAHVLISSALPQPEHLHGRRTSGAPVSSETHRTNAHSPRRLWSTHSRHCASARQASFHHLRPVSQSLLPAPRPLLQRYHVCPEHATATSVMLDGIVQRFCQQVRASCRAAHWYLLVYGCLQHRAWLHLSMLGYLALQQPPGQAESDPAPQRRRWFAGTALALTCARSPPPRTHAHPSAVRPFPPHGSILARHAQLPPPARATRRAAAQAAR
jgi:hypothetical protein